MEASNGYLKYQPKLKQTNLLFLFVQICTIIFIFSLLFLPIFKYSYQMEISLEFFNGDMEAYANFLKTLTPQEIKNGVAIYEKNFSVIDEIIKAGKAFKLEEEGASLVAFFFIMLPVFLVLMCGKLLYAAISNLNLCIKNQKDIGTYTFLEYNFIKKNKVDSDKETAAKKELIFGILIIFAMMIVTGKELGKTIFKDSPYQFIRYSNLEAFAGFSFWIIIPIIAIVAYCFYVFQLEKSRKKVVMEVLNENEDERKESNAEA